MIYLPSLPKSRYGILNGPEFTVILDSEQILYSGRNIYVLLKLQIYRVKQKEWDFRDDCTESVKSLYLQVISPAIVKNGSLLTNSFYRQLETIFYRQLETIFYRQLETIFYAEF